MEELSTQELKNVNGGDKFLYDVGHTVGKVIKATDEYLDELAYALKTVNWLGVS